MYLVGLVNTRISTGYTQKSPRTLLQILLFAHFDLLDIATFGCESSGGNRVLTYDRGTGS